jgi:hypothetical protein
MTTMILLDPTVTRRVAAVNAAVRRDRRQGDTVGLLWNSKPNGDVLLAAVRELLDDLNQGLRFVEVSKNSSARPMDESTREALAECHAVINAIGD